MAIPAAKRLQALAPPDASVHALRRMRGDLTMTDGPAPAPASAAYGRLRGAMIDALVCGRAGTCPRAIHDELAAWAAGIADAAGGEAIGLRCDGVPDGWWGALRWAGMPLAPGGEVRWGREVRPDRDIPRPEDFSGHLLLPEPDRLIDLTSLAMKPLRRFSAARFGCRLQAATGVQLTLWPDQALVVSCLDIPIGGFLYGPGSAHRCNLALEPGGFQVVRW